jgi:glycosyltransferase involved in cell wall biosynthesis
LGVPEAIRRRLADHRDRTFDRAVSRRLGPDDSAVITAYGAALETLEQAAALGTKSFLEYAIHHHRFAEEILQEERSLQPAFANTLQFHKPSSGRRRRAEAEIQRADRMILLSDFSKCTFVEQGVPAEKIQVVNLGVDTQAFRPPSVRNEGPFRVLFVGVFSQRKGLSYLIEGFRKAGIPGAELMLVGQTVGGDPWPDDPNIRRVPWARGAALAAAYQRASAFVLPSLVEGFARVVLEAMACGLPAIVTPNTGAGDVIEEGTNGFLVPIRDPEAIAARLRYLYEQPGETEAMGQAARQAAEANSWRDYGSRLVATLVKE